MELEQQPPEKPNFLLILILFAVAILIIFVIAIFVLHIGGRHFVPKANETHTWLHLPQMWLSAGARSV